MLEFTIDLKRPDFLSLRWDGSGFSYGNSFIKPFNHMAIGCFALGCSESNRFLFAVYERNFRGADPVEDLQALLLASNSQIDAVKAAMTGWPLNVVLIEVTESQVSIQSGAFVTCPIYIGADDGKIFGHWDAVVASRKLPNKIPNVSEIAAFMSSEIRYSSASFIEGISHLTERTVVNFDWRGIRLESPPDVKYIQPKIIRSGADVVAAFDEVLCGSVSQWFSPEYTALGVEASGGMDSSCVALSLRKEWQKDISTFSILLEEGDAGKQQRVRRDELIQKIGAVDHTVIGSDFLPMSRNLSCAPNEEIYLEALKAETELAVETQTRIIFTGNVIRAEWDGQAKENAEALVKDFESYLNENRDVIEALTIFYSQPARRREVTYDMIKQVMEKLRTDRPKLAPVRVWQAYALLDDCKSEAPTTELTALVSLILFFGRSMHAVCSGRAY